MHFNHLSWKDHIGKLASNLSKIVALFHRIKIYLPLKTRIIFYKTFFESGLTIVAPFGDNLRTYQEFKNDRN